MYLKVNDQLYPATFTGNNPDRSWDNRDSKTITLAMSYAEVSALLADGTAWSIVAENPMPVLDADGNPTSEMTMDTVEYDNSDYYILGDITVRTNGTVSVKMGKMTDLEEALALAFGGDEL